MSVANRVSLVPNRLLGVDISNLQGDVDWDNLAESGVTWCYIKEGEDRKIQSPNPYGYFTDQKFAHNWSEAKRVGMVRGVYRFVRPTGTGPADSLTRLQDHVESVGGLETGDFVVCDFEEEDGGDQLVWLSEWLVGARDSAKLCKGNKAVWTYSGLTYLQRHGCLVPGSTPTEYPYIHASYQKTKPPSPNGYTMRAWQYYSGASPIPGITGDIDLNVFLGTMDDLLSLCMP